MFVVLPTPSIARDREGRYLTGVMLGEAPLAVFGPSGTFSHVYGRFGPGPGEFGDSRVFIRVGASDAVHVFQDVTHTVLSPGARAFVTSRTIQVRPWCVTLEAETPIVCAPVQAPRGQATPLQVLAEDGTVARGIGLVADRPLDFRNPQDLDRRIGRAHAGAAVWSAHRIRYEMSRFDLAGREETRVVREAPWFPLRDEHIVGEGYRTRARPLVEGVREPIEGTLWVTISRGDPGYEPPTLPPGREGVRLDPFQDDNHRLDTVIEVLDVTRGRLLARAEVDPYLRFVSTPDNEVLLYSMRTLEGGDVVVDIWRAYLRTPRGGAARD